MLVAFAPSDRTDTNTTNRQGLERSLAQARRIAAQPLDDTIREELEEALKGN